MQNLYDQLVLMYVCAFYTNSSIDFLLEFLFNMWCNGLCWMIFYPLCERINWRTYTCAMVYASALFCFYVMCNYLTFFAFCITSRITVYNNELNLSSTWRAHSFVFLNGFGLSLITMGQCVKLYTLQSTFFLARIWIFNSLLWY